MTQYRRILCTLNRAEENSACEVEKGVNKGEEMDATVQFHGSKQENPSKKCNGGEREDIISRLPDDVLHHILSFLSTKEAIQTSILSTRWQYLWTSIPNIDLDDSLKWPGRGKSDWSTLFSNFVERVLLLHEPSTIKRLSLAFSVPVNASRVNSWVYSAIKHKVQELDLSLSLRAHFVLPCCLFTCESLVILKITMAHDLKVPSSIRFPNLRSLELLRLTFSDENSTERLFSSCPVLQELILIDCGWNNIRNITITIPTLKSFTIERFPYRKVNEDSLSCEIKIHAVNLISLDCTTTVAVDVLLYDLSSLEDASIDILDLRAGGEEVARRTIKLLNSILNVQYLTISDGTLSSLSFAENLRYDLGTFNRLIDLEVDSKFSIPAAGVLMNFLQKLPCLEYLDITEGLEMDLSEEDWLLESVPSCFKSHLKTFCISGFAGKAAEIYLLRFVLKNAIVLEEMSIYCKKGFLADVEKREEINNQLQMLPRGSERCVIVLL